MTTDHAYDAGWKITIHYEDGSSTQGDCAALYQIGDKIMALATLEGKGLAIDHIDIT